MWIRQGKTDIAKVIPPGQFKVTAANCSQLFRVLICNGAHPMAAYHIQARNRKRAKAVAISLYQMPGRELLPYDGILVSKDIEYWAGNSMFIDPELHKKEISNG